MAREVQVAAHLGADEAAADAATIIATLCCPTSIPENAAPNSYKQLCDDVKSAVLQAGTIEALTQVPNPLSVKEISRHS